MQIDGFITLKFLCRSSDIDEDKISRIDIDGLSELQKIYSKFNYCLGDINIYSEIDWNELSQRTILSYDINGPFYREVDGKIYKSIAALSPDEDGVFSSIKLPVFLRLSGSYKDFTPIKAVKKILFDVFFVSNLAVPGILNFYSAKVSVGDKQEELSLSNFYFEEALEFKEKGLFPFATCTSLEESKLWFESLNISAKMESDLPIERAIFSLLHICIMRGDVSVVSWIFHALESIYGTNSGRGFNDMSSQIFFLLDIPEDKKKKFKGKLRELNDLRSSFIHGGYKVQHPLNNEINDQIFDITNFGVVLIICSLQQLMKNKWSGLNVSQVYAGVKCD